MPLDKHNNIVLPGDIVKVRCNQEILAEIVYDCYGSIYVEPIRGFFVLGKEIEIYEYFEGDRKRETEV